MINMLTDSVGAVHSFASNSKFHQKTQLCRSIANADCWTRYEEVRFEGQMANGNSATDILVFCESADELSCSKA